MAADGFAIVSGASGGSTFDVGLARNNAGVVEVNSSVAGQLRDLKLRTLFFDDGTQISTAPSGGSSGLDGTTVTSETQLGTALGQGATLINIGAVFSLSSDTQIPVTTTLRFLDGARLEPQTVSGVRKTLTILGGIIAGRVQIFGGTGIISFDSQSGTNPKIDRYFVQWFGAKGTYTFDDPSAITDDTVALQKAIDSLPDWRVLSLGAGAIFRVTNKAGQNWALDVSHKAGIAIVAESLIGTNAYLGVIYTPPNQPTEFLPQTGTHHSAIIYDGVDGGTVLRLNSVKHSLFENFVIDCRNKANIGIDILQDNTGYNDKNGLSSDHRYRRVNVTMGNNSLYNNTGASVVNGRRPAWTGIRIGANSSNENNEFMDFEDCAIQGLTVEGQSYGTGTGIYLANNDNVKSVLTRRVLFDTLDMGINDVRGSFNANDNQFEHCKINYRIEAPRESITITNDNSEGAGQHAVIVSNNQTTVLFINPRCGGLDTNADASNLPHFDVQQLSYVTADSNGMLILLGTHFGESNVNGTAVKCTPASGFPNRARGGFLGFFNFFDGWTVDPTSWDYCNDTNTPRYYTPLADNGTNLTWYVGGQWDETASSSDTIIVGKLASYVPDAKAKATLSGNRTLVMKKLSSGATGTLRITQDGTGGRTLTFADPTGFTHAIRGGGSINPAANSTTVLAFEVIDAEVEWTIGR